MSTVSSERSAVLAPEDEPAQRASDNNDARRLAAAHKDARIRIAFCIDNMGIGGTELNALRTAERLDRSCFAVSVVCLQDDGPLLTRYRNLGIPVLALPLPRLHGVTALRQGARLFRYLVTQRVDIVHSHDVYNNIFATLCARLAHRPVVIASRRWHDDVPRRILRSANRFAYRLADCVLVNSPTIAELLVARERVDPSRVALVPNFVEDEAFAQPTTAEQERFLSDVGVPTDSFIVGCVASLRPVKDQALLFRAMAALKPRWPTLHLVLVGDGETRPLLEQLAQRLGISDAVHFAGLRENKPNLHHLFDVSVLSSRSEAVPNSLVEAMAAARPVVATCVGGVPDVVLDGETGLLVASGDVDAFARAVERLLRDPDLRRRYGKAGRERAATDFQARRVIPILESLYVRLLRERAR